MFSTEVILATALALAAGLLLGRWLERRTAAAPARVPLTVHLYRSGCLTREEASQLLDEQEQDARQVLNGPARRRQHLTVYRGGRRN